jgi:hypothetical protein
MVDKLLSQWKGEILEVRTAQGEFTAKSTSLENSSDISEIQIFDIADVYPADVKLLKPGAEILCSEFLKDISGQGRVRLAYLTVF